MFVKYRLLIKTLAGYYFLRGVSIGFSGTVLGLYGDFRSTLSDIHTSTFPFRFDTHHHSGFCFRTCQVVLWNLVRARLELSP